MPSPMSGFAGLSKELELKKNAVVGRGQFLIRRREFELLYIKPSAPKRAACADFI